MLNKISWVFWMGGLILIGNFIILRMYGDTLRSTHLFIVRNTVFYPLSWLNLVCGILSITLLIWNQFLKK